MRLKIEGKDKFETEPTGKEIKYVFEDLLQNMHDRVNTVTNKECHVTEYEGGVQSSLIVEKDGLDVNVTFKSEYGRQEDGYLIEIEIFDRGEQADKEVVQEVHDEIVQVLRGTVRLRE